MKTLFTSRATFTVIVLFGLVGYNFMNASWTAPTGTAPAGNTEAPINTGSTAQVKLGALGTGALSVSGNLLVSGATSTFNDVRAGRYCDRAGGNCFKAADVAAVDTGTFGDKTCSNLPLCGSAADVDSSIDCRISGSSNMIAGGSLCIARADASNRALTWGDASQACSSVHGAGYRLPTYQEIPNIYTERNNIGGFRTNHTGAYSAGYYWTSSDGDSNDGRLYVMLMTTGNLTYWYGTRPTAIRCVRGDLR